AGGEHIAEIEPGGGVIRFGFERALERALPRRNLALLQERDAEIVERGGEIGLHPDRVAIAGDRLVELAERAIDRPEIVVIVGLAVVERDRPLDRCERRFVPAELMLDEAEEMMRAGMLGRDVEHGAVERLRFDEPALLLQAEGGVETLDKIDHGMAPA